jgi:hypothetical protein
MQSMLVKRATGQRLAMVCNRGQRQATKASTIAQRWGGQMRMAGNAAAGKGATEDTTTNHHQEHRRRMAVGNKSGGL